MSRRVTELCRRLTSAYRAGVPGYLPPPTQPVLQASFFLNASRYRRSWVITRAILGSGCRQSLQNGAGEVLNLRVDCHPVVQFRIDRNLIFQMSLFLAQSVRLKSGRSGGY